MSIYEYSDYRAYLRAYIRKLPKQGRGEINRIAQAMGVHPSLLSQVLGDTKNLNLEQAQLLCEHLDMTSQEQDYFFCSVELQRAGTTKLQTYFKKQLQILKENSVELSQRVRQDRQLTNEEKSVFYSHWLFAAIWLQTSIKNGKTLEEICERFDISRERGREILHFLSETQLCILENSHYKMGPQSIHLERGSVHLSRHHSNWRLRAVEASDKIQAEEMMYTAPLSISKADFKKVRARLAEVIKEITDLAIDSEAEDAACFNLDFFWMK